MSQRVIVPIDADFEVAFARRFMGGAGAWAAIKAEAVQAARERLVRENIAAQHKTNAEIQTLSGPAWYAAQERFTALLAEHDELVRAAFPEQFTEASRG